MDRFIRDRLNDKRFDSRPVRTSGRPQVAWFEQARRAPEEVDLIVRRHNASATKYEKGPDSPKKKTKKRKKSDDDGTSDGSDSSPCWSDYERVPGTKEGEKGSCRPKGSGNGEGEKKKKKKKEEEKKDD